MVISTDFDGTLVEHAYPAIGKPIPFAIETLIKLQQEDHHQIILWTSREGKLLDEAVEYCKSKGLEFYAVNSNFPEEKQEDRPNRKLVADIYIDDRNLGGLPEWGIIYQMIHSGRAHMPAPEGNIDDRPRRRGILERLLG